MARTRIKRKTRHKTRHRKSNKQMRNKRRISRRRVMREGGKGFHRDDCPPYDRHMGNC